ncbi:MAG: exodeoxyribonuclease VII large subunit [Alphaproteobacteria bacterium]|nr:exodeoxyribonuclease VII large subunit [Alphaproteobacteria bacterium]
MTDPSSANAPTNYPEYTVSELAGALKRKIEDSFGRVRVRGETSRVKAYPSGHVYITLKDEGSVLEAICYRTTWARLKFKPGDGLEVICSGRLTTYQSRSQYQLIIDHVEPAGVGALMALLEERRRKLMAEGLFEASRKKALPYLPDVVGVVTSLSGAVIRDILHRLRERFPRHVLIWPVAVQGDGAADQIARAIAGFNRLPPDGPVPRPDLLIVARGGGSLEDLWPFNEEIVVRATAASGIPLISAVGHETDTTLIDFAADKRAPTPTAAAEMAVPVRRELLYQVSDQQRRLLGGIHRRLRTAEAELQAARRGLRDPRERVRAAEQRLDDLGERLGRALRANLLLSGRRLGEAGRGLRPRVLRRSFHEAQRGTTIAGQRLARALLADVRHHRTHFEVIMRRFHVGLVDRRFDRAAERLGGQVRLLESFGYQNVLNRGFALVRDSNGAPVKEVAAALPGKPVVLEFRDGSVGAHIADDASPSLKAPRPPARFRRRSRVTPDEKQGKLL